MQPLRLAANPKAGFIHVLDRCRCHVVAHGIGETLKRCAQSWLIRAIVAVARFTPNRSAISAARRFSGSNW